MSQKPSAVLQNASNIPAKFLAALLLTFALLVALGACGGARTTRARAVRDASTDDGFRRDARPGASAPAPYKARMVHVVVALCDNVNQGIVPVPASLGNGDDPSRNLYWGARFGVKTFFKRSDVWRLVAEMKNPRPPILERLIFKHRSMNAFLVADAYRGAEIKQATYDFLEDAAAASRETVNVEGQELGLSAGGTAHMVAYVGHNGLMDFRLADHPQPPTDATHDAPRDAVILACASKNYFAAPLRATGARPLLWTTNLMAPEAYVLKAAIDGWLRDETGESIRLRAAAEYHAYQKCGLGAARKLFASGW